MLPHLKNSVNTDKKNGMLAGLYRQKLHKDQHQICNSTDFLATKNKCTEGKQKRDKHDLSALSDGHKSICSGTRMDINI